MLECMVPLRAAEKVTAAPSNLPPELVSIEKKYLEAAIQCADALAKHVRKGVHGKGGLEWKTLRALNKIATGGLTPKLTVFVDIDPARGLNDAKDPNRFEAEGVAFQTRVRKGFLKIIREEPKRFIKMKARSGTPPEMAEALLKLIQKRVKL